MGLVLLIYFFLESCEHHEVKKSKLYGEATWKRTEEHAGLEWASDTYDPIQ